VPRSVITATAKSPSYMRRTSTDNSVSTIGTNASAPPPRLKDTSKDTLTDNDKVTPIGTRPTETGTCTGTGEEVHQDVKQNVVSVAEITKKSEVVVKISETSRLNKLLNGIKEKNREDLHQYSRKKEGDRPGKKRVLTQPRAPKLLSAKKNGERTYSCVGPRVKRAEKETNTPIEAPVDLWKNRVLTVPKPPTFATTKLHGERKYSSVGAGVQKREIEKEAKAREEMLRKADWRKRVPTKARAPKLATAAKLGERKYANVGSSKEEEKDIVQLDWTNRKLTQPKAPKLSCTERMGERKYANVGPKEKKEEVKPIQLDWTDRQVTVPKAPRLSSAHRHRVSEVPAEKPFIFKARAIGKGVLGGSSNVGVRKVTTRSPTAYKPFALTERPKKQAILSPREEKFTFRARPLPKFSSPDKASSKRLSTESQPFYLATNNRAEPKEVRRQEALKLHPRSPMRSPPKRILTSHQPFRLSCATRPTLRSPKPKSAGIALPPKTKRVTRPSTSIYDSAGRRKTKGTKVTTPRPFRLTVTSPKESLSKEKSQSAEKKAEALFRARPMPSFKAPKKISSTRVATVSEPFRLGTLAGPRTHEQLEKKLAMQSKQSPAAREKQSEETQKVLDKLQQLDSNLSISPDHSRTEEMTCVENEAILKNDESKIHAQPQDPDAVAPDSDDVLMKIQQLSAELRISHDLTVKAMDTEAEAPHIDDTVTMSITQSQSESPDVSVDSILSGHVAALSLEACLEATL